MRAYTLLGVPAQEITVFAGGGSACWAVDLDREYGFDVALAVTARAGHARFVVRLPQDEFPWRPIGGWIDFGTLRSVCDTAPLPDVDHREIDHREIDPAALLGEVRRTAPVWRFAGYDELGGTRFAAPRDAAAASGCTPVAATVDQWGQLDTVECVLASHPAGPPAVVHFFEYGQAGRVPPAREVRS